MDGLFFLGSHSVAFSQNDFEFFLRNTWIDYIDGWIYGYNKALIND